MFDGFNISPKGTDAKKGIKLACFPLKTINCRQNQNNL